MRPIVVATSIIAAMLLPFHIALAQFLQQGPKLVGTGAVGGYAAQGSAVAISADGRTAIVGGPRDNNGTGGAWIWINDGGVWTQKGPKLVGSGSEGYSGQGSSVGISADGNTAIVGGPDDNHLSTGESVGAAWVWIRSGGLWVQQGLKLVGSGAEGPSAQGTSVAVSADGNTAVVGGPGDGPGYSRGGAAWVWTRSAGAWTQQGPKLVGSGAVGVHFSVLQGSSVSVSADGNTAAIGARQDNELRHRVRIT